jgi:hypothetical protein
VKKVKKRIGFESKKRREKILAFDLGKKREGDRRRLERVFRI